MDEGSKVMDSQIIENDGEAAISRGCLHVVSGHPFSGVQASDEYIEVISIIQAIKNQVAMITGIPQEKLKAIASADVTAQAAARSASRYQLA